MSFGSETGPAMCWCSVSALRSAVAAQIVQSMPGSVGMAWDWCWQILGCMCYEQEHESSIPLVWWQVES